MMNMLAQAGAFTTGSGLLVGSVISQAVVTVPLAAKSDIRIGWGKPSPQIESFVRWKLLWRIPSASRNGSANHWQNKNEGAAR